MTNTNWTETQDGYVKNEQSKVRGSSPFDKPMPPVRENGLPLIRGGGGKIDWQKVWQEKSSNDTPHVPQ